MRRLHALCAGALVLLAGCFELELGVTLAADGSGTQTLHLGMTDAVVRSVRLSAQALDTRGDPLQVLDRESVAGALREQGLALTEHRVYRERGRQMVDAKASFADFAMLRRSTLFGGQDEWLLLPGRNPGGVRLVFYPRGHAAWLTAKAQADELREMPSAAQQQFFEAQKQRITGLDVTLRIALPGDVDYTSGNLTAAGPREVVARVDPARIATAADLVLALAPRYEVEFDGRACQLPLEAGDPGVAAAPR